MENLLDRMIDSNEGFEDRSIDTELPCLCVLDEYDEYLDRTEEIYNMMDQIEAGVDVYN